jgi:hypothetical protein
MNSCTGPQRRIRWLPSCVTDPEIGEVSSQRDCVADTYKALHTYWEAG